MTIRIAFAIALAAAFAANSALAGPYVYEETARLVPPDSSYAHVEAVAVDGDRLVMAASRSDDWPDVIGSIYVFERAANGSWQYVTPVWLDQPLDDSSMINNMTVSIKGNVIAATTFNRLMIFERVGTGWANTATFRSFPDVGDFGADVEVDGDTVLVAASGSSGYEGVVVRKNVSGQWVQETTLDGAFHEFDSETNGSSIALAGNVGAVATPYTPGSASSEMFIYERSGTTWTNTAHFTTMPGGSFGSLTTDATNLVATGGTAGADATVYGRAGGAWSPTQTLNANPGRLGSLALGTGLVAGSASAVSMRGTRSGAVDIYELATSGGSTEPSARLLASDGQAEDGLGTADVSARRVVAASVRAAYVYDLPASFPQQPALVQEDFNNGSSANWAPLAGSSFSLATDASGSTVYRQTSLTGDAGALRNNTDWTNQSIQASITPRAFNGADRWFGLVVRHQDPSNYYYVTARSTNVIQLRRMLNGTYTTLASANLPIALNQTYSVRLEAAGSLLRVFVNGKEMLKVRDTSISHGQAGIRMHKTSADFDNVLVTPNPQNDAFPANFEGTWDGFGPVTSGTWNRQQQDGSWVYVQSALDVTARSYVWDHVDAMDQIIQVRAKANQYAAGTTERWFGVAGRVTDDANYYYMTVRNTNRVSLRKLVNDTITELDFASMPVSLGTWYSLRLEIVGDRLKGYVNDVLVVEATDSTFAQGKAGLITVKTTASFDDFSMLQP